MKIFNIRCVIAMAVILSCWIGPAQALKAKYSEILPNGMKAIVHPTYSSPTVSINIFIGVGSFEEDEAISGMSHFYEHLFFRGTPKWPGYQFKRQLEALGGRTNAETTRDMTHFFVNMPKENVKQGIEMMADAFINASLEQEAVDQERKAILEEYNLSKDNAQRLVYDRLYSLAYPKGHPYHSSVIGTETNLRSFQSADLQRFRDLFYAPERSVITVVGDVNPHEVMAQLREQFGEFRRVASHPIRRVSNSEPPADTVAQNMEGNIKNSVIIMGYVGPSVHDKPDIYRMDVASFLLGIGRGSIINREVVETQKAFVAGVDFLTQRFSGLVLMHAIASPDKLEETKQALLASVQRLKNGEISERDLKRAKNFLRGNFQLGNESNAGKAESLGFYAVLGEEDFPEEYCAQLENVTLEDVVNVANKYFNDGFYSVTMVHEEPKVVRRSRLDDYDGMGRWTGGRR